MEIAEMAV
jgi:hypothetical protein